MNALKRYLNPMQYVTGSLNEFVKETKKNDGNGKNYIKCINIILDHAYVDARIPMSEIVDSKITYEAISSSLYKRKITFSKEHDDMSPLELIAYAGRRVRWLKKKLPGKEITIMNENREPINKGYEMMLKFSSEILTKKKHDR